MFFIKNSLVISLFIFVKSIIINNAVSNTTIQLKDTTNSTTTVRLSDIDRVYLPERPYNSTTAELEAKDRYLGSRPTDAASKTTVAVSDVDRFHEPERVRKPTHVGARTEDRLFGNRPVTATTTTNSTLRQKKSYFDRFNNNDPVLQSSASQLSTGIPEQHCTTQTGVNGLCLSRTECSRSRGIATGYCGTFGVCCDINLQCSGVSKLKRTIIRDPNPLPTRCTYHFQAYSTRVCQLRLDFDIVLAQPTIPTAANGLRAVTCVLDKFEAGPITICGTNIKQHIYLPFDVANGMTDLAITFVLADRKRNPSLIGNWNIIATQLECPSPAISKRSPFIRQISQPNSLADWKSMLTPFAGDGELIAPNGCLQYFYKRTGTIESFNFNNRLGPYIGHMRYGICFKRSPMDVSVQFSAVFFEIAAAAAAMGFINTDCRASSTTVPGPSNDYLLVVESLLETTPASVFGTYYCGTSLEGNELLHSPPGPFVIYFNSDGEYSATYPETGFRINYSIQ